MKLLTISSFILTIACNAPRTCDADKCVSDPKPAQAELDKCNKLASGTCGSAYLDVLACEQSQQKCAADGTTDESATEIAFTTNCGEQVSNLSSCCAANAPACQ